MGYIQQFKMMDSRWQMLPVLYLVINDIIMTLLLLFKIIFVLANFLKLSKTLRFKYFRFISSLREIWILPINSAI